jgi:hypothetical protein
MGAGLRPHEARLLRRVRALVLLGGSLRPSLLSAATGRAVLDLPLSADKTLLEEWRDQIAVLRRQCRMDDLAVQLQLDQHSLAPRGPTANGCGVRVHTARDAARYRGTAGLLHDLAKEFDDDDYVLAATAAQMLTEPLADLAVHLAERVADVTLLSHEDGAPCGLMLVRCGCLRWISDIGYVDMKEMALPRIARHFTVKVVGRKRASALPIRTPQDYLRALRAYHCREKGLTDGPFEEEWKRSFSVVEAGAAVHPGAKLYDSVVLRGAQVNASAVLVRSILTGSAVVERPVKLVDQLS